MELRKLLVQKEVVLAEGGKEAATPIVRVCAIAMFQASQKQIRTNFVAVSKQAV